jgi:CRISPR-associated protein Csx17
MAIQRMAAPSRNIKAGKAGDEDERRIAILRHCRNRLNDRAVEWLDAVVGIAADGSRSFAPVLGTGGNEGRLDYTNNFMARIAALLISPDRAMPVRELLGNALFGYRTTALQAGAAGQL